MLPSGTRHFIQALAIVAMLILQLVAGHLLGFGVAYGLAIGNGWELVVIPLGNALGIWLVGLAGRWITERRRPRDGGQRLVATLVGSGAGAAILAVPRVAFGFEGLLLPLAGGMAGYYLAGLVGPRRAR